MTNPALLESIARARYMQVRTGREFCVRNRSTDHGRDDFLICPRYLNGFEGLLMDYTKPVPCKVWPQEFE